MTSDKAPQACENLSSKCQLRDVGSVCQQGKTDVCRFVKSLTKGKVSANGAPCLLCVCACDVHEVARSSGALPACLSKGDPNVSTYDLLVVKVLLSQRKVVCCYRVELKLNISKLDSKDGHLSKLLNKFSSSDCCQLCLEDPACGNFVVVGPGIDVPNNILQKLARERIIVVDVKGFVEKLKCASGDLDALRGAA